jgi:hypothetical protein
MSNQFLNRPRRVLPLVIGGVLALLAFVAIGVAIESALSPHKAETTTPPTAVPLIGATQTSPSDAPSATALTVVQGSDLVNGLYVGFPHSLTGAVSAAAEYWTQIGSTLDPDRTATIARLAADPSWSDAATQLAEGPINTRQALGLTTSGAVPTGASVELEPVEYQVRNVAANSVTVLLLADYTTTTPSSGSTTHVGVFPLQLAWTTGDWKIEKPTDNTDYSGLAATPGSAQASADGWAQLAQ